MGPSESQGTTSYWPLSSVDRTLASGASASLLDMVLPEAPPPRKGLVLKHTATAIREGLPRLLLKLKEAPWKRQAPGSTSQPTRPQVNTPSVFALEG